jgi:hypothetical protein
VYYRSTAGQAHRIGLNPRARFPSDYNCMNTA